MKNWLFCLFWRMRAAALPFTRFRRWWAGRAAAAGWNAPGRTPRPLARQLLAGLAGIVGGEGALPVPLVVPGRQRGVHLGLRGQRTLLVRHPAAGPGRLRSLRSALAWSSARNCSTVCPRTCRNWSKLTRWACRLRWKRRCSAKVMLRHQLPGQRAGHPVPQAEDQPGLGQLPGLLAAPGVQPGDPPVGAAGALPAASAARSSAPVVLVDLQLDGQAADGPRLNGLDKAGVLPQGEGRQGKKTPPRPGSPPPC